MRTLTNDGQQKVQDISARYNLKPETVKTLLTAIIRGNGTMAQFNLPELGGPGQWMKGGMTMVGDMFNSSLRSTVDMLCTELAGLVTTSVLFMNEEEGQDAFATERQASPYSQVSTSWPTVFGNPTSTGSQNNFRYAYFAPVHRLVIEDNGKRTIYDTKHHQITGVSQQQGTTTSYRFTSQEGLVDLNSLEKVSDPDRQQPTQEDKYGITENADLRIRDKSPEDIILATIEKLNVLFERGKISEEEFRAKKQELLSRL